MASCKSLAVPGTATIDDVGIEVDEGMHSAGEKQRALGARTLELLRRLQAFKQALFGVLRKHDSIS